MNRLTDRSKEIQLPCTDNGVFWARVHEKLARYEDTGLEPDECAKYAQAEKEGRLVVLPCKVGDTLWFNTYKNNATECVGIQPHEVKRVNACFLTDGAEIPQWALGKTVFPTREEAEKALEEMNNDER